MGRVENNEQQIHEAIDDSFPETEQQQPVTTPRSRAPSNNRPQTNHPSKQEEDLHYVTSQDHHNHHQHVPPQANAHFVHHQPGPQPGVPVGHPMTPPVHPLNVNGQMADRAWNSDLFDCMNDPENALITAFCPCVTFGQIAEILDKGNTPCATSGVLYGVIAFCIAAPCIMSCTYRTKLRAKFELMETPAQDWLVHCFCEWCALCQEYRELRHMGYDPKIGWLGNQARMGQQQNQQYGMTPPMGQRMRM